MSEENVEIVRRVIDAWNRRDIEELHALTDPEAEYVNSPTAIEPGTRRGRDETTAVMRAQWESLTDARTEIDRIYDRGEEVIATSYGSRPQRAKLRSASRRTRAKPAPVQGHLTGYPCWSHIRRGHDG